MNSHDIIKTVIQYAVLIEALRFEYRLLKTRCEGLLENHQDATVESLETVFEAIDAQIELYQARIDELSKELSRLY